MRSPCLKCSRRDIEKKDCALSCDRLDKYKLFLMKNDFNGAGSSFDACVSIPVFKVRI